MKAKILTASLLFAVMSANMQAQVAWDGYSIATSYAGGTGTKTNPYLISTAPQFIYFLQELKGGQTYSGKYFKLTNEISLCGYPLNFTGAPLSSYNTWSGAGTFDGYFDGNNHFINSVSYANYIISTLNGTICNLGIENDNAAGGYGGIVYSVESTGQIISCTRVLTGANDGGYRSYPVRWPFSNYNRGEIINCKLEGRINTTNEYGYNYYSAGIAVNNYGTILNTDVSSYSFYSYTSGTSTKKIVSNNYYGAIVDFGDLGPGYGSYNNTPVTNSTEQYEEWKAAHPSVNYTLPSQSQTKQVSFTDPYGIISYSPIIVPMNAYLGSYLNDPVVDDCIFAGWNVKGKTYATSSLIKVTDNLNITPLWTQKITSQPTSKKPTVSVSDSKHAIYQWHAMVGTKSTYPNWTSTNYSHNSVSRQVYSLAVKEGQRLSLDWKTSSEYADRLIISINGTTILSQGGIDVSGTLEYDFSTAGNYNLELAYEKDDTYSNGQDKVWVSNIWVGNAPFVITGETTNTLSSGVLEKDGSAWCEISYTNSDTHLISEAFEVEANPDTDISGLTNVIYVPTDTEIRKGSLSAVSVNMKNNTGITGFEFSFCLPEGFSVASVKRGSRLMTKINDEYAYSFNSSKNSDGSTYVLCYSASSIDIADNDGEIAIVTLNVPDDVEPGEYPIILRDIEMSKAGSSLRTDYVKSTLIVEDYLLGDATGDGRLSVADLTAVASHLLGNTPDGFNIKSADANTDGRISVADLTAIASFLLGGSNHAPKMNSQEEVENAELVIDPVSISAGQTVCVPVAVTGSFPFSAYQFDASLPEGISILSSANGTAQVSLSTERTNAELTDNFKSSFINENKLRVICYSSSNALFEDAEGSVAYMNITTEEGLMPGTYTITIDNAELAHRGVSKPLSPVSIQILVTETTGLDMIGQTGQSLVYDMNGKTINSNVSELPTGIYVIDGKKVLINK